MKKQERNEIYMFYFVCRTFHCKDMTPLILGDFDKNVFSHSWQLYKYTVDLR